MPLQLSLFDPPPAGPRTPVVVARGPLAAEELLLSTVDGLLDAAAGDPALLARPVRIVVPSRSLREHVAAAFVRRRGRAVAGVVVETLHGLACEVLASAGEAPPTGAPAFDLLARRFAALEAPLRPLDSLVDGYGTVAGTIRDLLDAGLTAAHADAAEEALAELGRHAASRPAVERARALVRIAAQVDRAAERLGIGRASHLFRRAVEILAADPEAALPARALWIHGFADATGVATDLLAQLLKHPAATLILDRPPDPARPGGEESAFTARLAEALAPGAAASGWRGAAPAERPAGTAAPARFMAPGAEAEIREVAVRIGDLLAAGVAAERIGVVARDLAPYRRAIRRHFGRLGIPFSGAGERGSVTPTGRRAAALFDLLERREASPCDRWLDALASLPGDTAREGHRRLAVDAQRRLPITARRRVDLRLAIRTLGAARLADLAALDPRDITPLLRDGRLPLPIRQGLRTAAALEAAAAEADFGGDAEREPQESDESAPRASRAAARTVAGGELERARAAAAALVARFAAWPAEASAAAHRALLAALLGEELGWGRRPAADRGRAGGWLARARERLREPGLAAVDAALDDLAAELPDGLPITLSELARLLARALAEAATDPLGGAGGGVQVLSATEARGRTFEHLFVVGLNRDVFPRTIREDPLLSDDLRRVLRGPGGAGVLPDVPIKSGGFDEERYLFAQLLQAAPAVTLSWQAADDDGRPLAASPLLARAASTAPPAIAPALDAAPAAAGSPRPAFEAAILAGLHAGRDAWRPLLPAAIGEARAELDPAAREAGGDLHAAAYGGADLDAAALAAVRLAVLDEIDPDRRTSSGRAVRLLAGPYFGFLGRTPRSGGDPRHRDLYVTTLESLAACPWQTFLERLLEVEPTPDPLEALPGLDPLLVGNVVHAVLERIVARSLPADGRGGELAVAGTGWADRPFHPAPWPPPSDVERYLAAAAARVAADEGIPLRGLARALAERARPFVDAARAADWSDAALPPLVVGAELRGEVEVAGGAQAPRTLFFRADRVDRGEGGAGGEGGAVLTDYKTGKPFTEAKKAASRRQAFLRRVREGKSLQAVAYQLGGGAGAAGRYLFLRPDLDADHRAVEVPPGDAAAAAFGQAVAAALAAWDAGSLFPRLVDVAGRQEPARCRFCRVAEACLRGDSGARSRLLAYAAEARAASGGEAAAFAGLWHLAVAPVGSPPEPEAAAGEAQSDAAEGR